MAAPSTDTLPMTNRVETSGHGQDVSIPTIVLPARPEPAVSHPTALPDEVQVLNRDIESGIPLQSRLSRTSIGSLGQSADSSGLTSLSPPAASATDDAAIPVGTENTSEQIQLKFNFFRVRWKSLRSLVNIVAARSDGSSPRESIHILDRIEMQNQVAPEFFTRAPLKNSRQAALLRAGRHRGGADSTLVNGGVIGPPPPPLYSEDFVPESSNKTIPEYLWRFGFLFPPLWIVGSLYLKAGLSPRWIFRLEELDHPHREDSRRFLRQREKKYARRCLFCLVVTLFVSAALVEGLTFGLVNS